MSRILTPAEIAALTDSEWLERVATGPVIPADSVARHLESGHRVYGIRDRAGSPIERVHSPDTPLLGYWVGAGVVPISRA
jgi:hypothetical protein